MPFTNTKLFEYAQNLANLKDTEDKIFKIVLDNRFIKELIKHLNTEEQLRKDRTDSLGARLGVYSFATEFISGGEKKAGEFINLFKTGAFYDSWIVEVREALILINANPLKDGTNLFDEYGIDVLGLTDENLQIIIDHALEFHINYYRRNILPK